MNFINRGAISPGVIHSFNVGILEEPAAVSKSKYRVLETAILNIEYGIRVTPTPKLIYFWGKDVELRKPAANCPDECQPAIILNTAAIY